jgi:hypothetical protein
MRWASCYETEGRNVSEWALVEAATKKPEKVAKREQSYTNPSGARLAAVAQQEFNFHKISLGINDSTKRVRRQCRWVPKVELARIHERRTANR